MINRLFTTIVNNIASNVQDTSSAMQTIIKRYANDSYFDILKRVNFEEIDDDYSFNTVAGTKDYILPRNFGKEVYVYDATNKIEIPGVSLQELINLNSADLEATGNIQKYVILNKPVRLQPTSASTLSVVSSSASDSSQTVAIKYLDSNGIEIYETVTLTGTTPVVTSGSAVEILSISKSAVSVGRITVTANAGAVTVAVLAPADLAYFVSAVRFHYTPNGVVTINIPFIKRPYPLYNDYDQPIIDCADVIELGATAMAWRYKRQFSKAQEYERLYNVAFDTLVWDKENSFNKVKTTIPKPYSREDY